MAVTRRDATRNEASDGAPRQADEAVGVLPERFARERWGKGAAIRRWARVGMGDRQKATEVGVARLIANEKGQVRAVLEGDLGAGDRPHSKRTRGVGELERSGQAIVVRERDCAVAELGSPGGDLRRRRGAVQEAERRVAVEFDVLSLGSGRHMRTYVRIWDQARVLRSGGPVSQAVPRASLQAVASCPGCPCCPSARSPFRPGSAPCRKPLPPFDFRSAPGP